MRRDIEAQVEKLSQPQPGTSALHFESEHAQGLVRTLVAVDIKVPCHAANSGCIARVASICMPQPCSISCSRQTF